MISGHTEPTQGTACPLESSDFRDICNQRNSSDQVLSRLRSESWVGNPISHSLSSVTLGYTQGEFFLYWNYGHDMKPIAWWSYRVRVISPSSCWEYFPTHIQLWWSLKSYGHTVLAGVTFVSCPLHQSRGVPLRFIIPQTRTASLIVQIVWCPSI